MPRIRSIKPHAFRSLALAQVPVPARWLFAGLLTEADDQGRLADHLALIRSQVLPLDDVTTTDVEAWIDALATAGALCRYEAGDARYIHVVGFLDHPEWGQVINRPSASSLPGCPTHDSLELRPVDPRRCAAHQGATTPGPCRACKAARLAHEAKPTFSAKTVMCTEHPQHKARNCPECAALATAPRAGWRNPKGA